MAMWDLAGPVQVSRQPMLSDSPAMQMSEPARVEAPVAVAPVAVCQYQPAISPPELHAILVELRGLRQDLAERTFAARCRRFWNWLCRWSG